MPDCYLRQYKALERIDIVSNYKDTPRAQLFRLELCEDLICLEDPDFYEDSLMLVDL